MELVALTSSPVPRSKASRRPGGGTLWSALLTGGFSGLLATGLFIWLEFSQGALAGQVVLIHLWAGLAFTVLLVPWLVSHVPHGMRGARRRSFFFLGWALLAKYLLVLVTGIAMAWPALMWFAGSVSFPDRVVTETFSFLHFWGSMAAVAGLLLHLAMRHWLWTKPAGDAG